jgi:hypothetical protein
MEHYAGALRETHPATTIHAANNLFVAVETWPAGSPSVWLANQPALQEQLAVENGP